MVVLLGCVFVLAPELLLLPQPLNTKVVVINIRIIDFLFISEPPFLEYSILFLDEIMTWKFLGRRNCYFS
jgi:hypothetical protein